MHQIIEKYPEIKNKILDFDDYLLGLLHSTQPLIADVIDDLVRAGGKRLRPILVIVSSQYKNLPAEKILPVAAAVEIMHMATLVHDDIIDEAKLRRGAVTAQARYGKDVAVFAGDFLFSKAFLILSTEVDQDFLKRMAQAIKYICEGEIDQYQNRYNTDTSYLAYFKRIRRKTAILVQASCFAGAYVAKLKKKQLISLAKYGHYLGMVFQITDDLLDLVGKEELTGKPVANDFSQGIYTLPIIFALHDQEKGPELLKLLKEDRLDFKELSNLIEETNALDRTREVLNWYANKARKELAKLPKNVEATHFLQDLLDYILGRSC